MPIQHIAVETNNMDSSKPDRTETGEAGVIDGAGVTNVTGVVGEASIMDGTGVDTTGPTLEVPGDTGERTGEADILDDVEERNIDDADCDSGEERETDLESTCDTDIAVCAGTDSTGTGRAMCGTDNAMCGTDSAMCGTDNAVCNAHIVVDTVIVRDSDSVSYRNDEAGKEEQTGSEVHINVQTIPASRNESNNSPGNGGTESKRNRSSGKSSKKDKPSPFKKKDSLPTKEILNPNSPTPLSTDRCDSSLSTTSGDLCRICQCDKCEIQYDSPLVSPCLCSGSLKYIHQACLQKWIKSSDKLSCELCMFEYSMTKKTKPFTEWERLDMTPAERRKVICSVTFHVIAITCVVWSLYVLIDRTTEEVEAGTLLWPFWTKLIVVAIGFTGGVVFMYVQCKMYLTLCKKWRMYNKVIIISSISEGQREKANQQGILRINAKQAQLEAERPDLNVFNIVNETESV